MSYSKDGKDWLGRDRVEHFDDKGNKVGTSKDGKDWLGKERTEHFDEKGNKVGVSKDGKDWLGNDRAEHFDDSGKKTGTSKSEKDIFGNNIIQHYDNQGNKTKYTKAEKNWLGQTIFRHRSGGGSGDGLYGIIAVIIIIVLIVVAILGTFSYPYKVIDSNISPFHLDWTSNENVWIFCCAFWILLILSLTNIKKLFQKSADDSQDESSLIKQTIILVLITTTFLMVIQYFIKSRFGESYLLISIILDLLIVGGIFFINKGSKFKFYLLGVSLVISAISLIYINQKTNVLISQNNVESQSIVVNSEKEDLKSSNTSNEASTPSQSSSVNELIIGSQVWMTKNLDVDKFRNGDPIPQATTIEQWEELNDNKQPAWSYYENDPANEEKYGKLYNWYAVNDIRGIAPKGWHVASLKEWVNLIDSQGGFTEETAKKFIDARDWGISELQKSNDFNFSAKPGGGIISIGSMGNLYYEESGKSAYWWTSTKSNGIPAAKVIYIITNTYQGFSIDFNSNDYGHVLGLSVRCIKD